MDRSAAYYLKLYGITLAVFVAADLVWLGLVAREFYRDQLGFLIASDPNLAAVLAFYPVFVGGMLVFVVVPGLRAEGWRATAGRAALFGLVTYATYDLTNMATVRDWPLPVTVVDLAWGVGVSVAVGLAALAAGRRIG
jgi:uncharacterized membrane protein